MVLQQSGKTDSLLGIIAAQNESLLRAKELTEPAQTREAEKSDWRYFLSALAQSLAAIATLVFTVTLVVSQLRARYGLRVAQEVLNWGNVVRFGYFLISVAASLWAIHRPEDWFRVISWALAIGCVPILFWHFWDTRRSLSLRRVVSKYGKEARRQLRTGSDSTEKLRDLEYIAHGALAHSDFDTLDATTEELATAAAEAAKQNLGETVDDAFEYIRGVCFEATRSPKATLIATVGVTKGIGKRGGAVLRDLAGNAIDTFDMSLRMCDWPKQEEIYAAVFVAVQKLLKELVDKEAADSALAGNIIDRCVKLLARANKRRLHEPEPGSGHAAYTLFETCLAGATYAAARDNVVEAKSFLNACLSRALNIAGLPHAYVELQQYLPDAVRKSVETLKEVARHLDEKEMLKPIRGLLVTQDSDLAAATVEWRELTAVFIDERAFELANVSLANLNRLLELRVSELAAVVDTLELLAERSDVLSTQTKQMPAAAVTLDALRKKWYPGAPETLRITVSFLQLMKAGVPYLHKDVHSIIPESWGVAYDMHDKTHASEEATAEVKKQVSYLAVVVAGLKAVHLGQFGGPERADEIEGLRRILAKYPLPDRDQLTKRAKQEFPKYGATLTDFIRGI